MKFSFVIPAYNEEGYLDKCLKSIKRQKCKDYEIIVSYSPSSDKTLRIARNFRASVVKVPRCTPAKARNAGAKKTIGKYIVFLDADVQLPKNFLEVTNRILERGAVAVGYELTPAENDPEIRKDYKFIFNPFNRCFKNLSCCYVVEKSAFDAVGGYDERREVGEDVEISTRLAKAGRVEFTGRTVPKVSLRRFSRMGKNRALGMYVSWFILGFILGAKARYFHVSDIGKKISREV